MFNLGRALGCSWDHFWLTGILRGPWEPPKGPYGAKTGPFGGPGGPEETLYKVKVLGNHDSNPVRPIGGSWYQI